MFDIQRKKWPLAAILPLVTIVPSRPLGSEDHQVIAEPSKNEPGVGQPPVGWPTVWPVVLKTSPARLNAMSRAMRTELTRLLAEFDEDPGTGAIVVTGAANSSFSAGQDLSAGATDEWRGGRVVGRGVGGRVPGGAAPLNPDDRRAQRLRRRRRSANGACLRPSSRIADGAGRHARDQRRDPVHHGQLGPLAGLIGDARIADLVLTGRLISADEMLSWGLVSEVVEPERAVRTGQRAGRAAGPLGRPDIGAQKGVAATPAASTVLAAVQAARAGHRQAFDSGAPAAAMTKFLSRTRD